MLQKYVAKGCMIDCRIPWTRDHVLEAAIHQGPHISAKSLQAACLREKTLEKVKQGYAKMNWDDIQDNPHPNLKISLLVAVPHKS